VFHANGSYTQDWLYLPTDWNWRLQPELSGESRAVADVGSHWCDCGAELDLLDRAVRSCIATPAREGFPAWLTDLKQRSPAP